MSRQTLAAMPPQERLSMPDFALTVNAVADLLGARRII